MFNGANAGGADGDASPRREFQSFLGRGWHFVDLTMDVMVFDMNRLDGAKCAQTDVQSYVGGRYISLMQNF